MDKLFETIDLMDDSRRKRGADSHLVRKTMKDVGKDGRYISSRPAEKTTEDLAIDATIRHAAPYQRKRREQTGRNDIIVMPSDLRQKVREKHTSCLFFFMVDSDTDAVRMVLGKAVNRSFIVMSDMRRLKAMQLPVTDLAKCVQDIFLIGNQQQFVHSRPPQFTESDLCIIAHTFR